MARDVGKWLGDLELESYLELFLENQIDLDAARDLTEADLKELGIPMGPRKKLLRAIAVLENSLTPSLQGSVATLNAEPSAEAERRQLTVMFCDLVGSTARSLVLCCRTVWRAYRKVHGRWTVGLFWVSTGP